jgi:hypothetical protein
MLLSTESLGVARRFGHAGLLASQKLIGERAESCAHERSEQVDPESVELDCC